MSLRDAWAHLVRIDGTCHVGSRPFSRDESWCTTHAKVATNGRCCIGRALDDVAAALRPHLEREGE